jgi:hypothetical protein
LIRSRWFVASSAKNGTDYVRIWLALADQGGAFNFSGCCSWGNQSRLLPV